MGARVRVSSSIAARLGLGVLLVVAAAFAIALWTVTTGEEREFQERARREGTNIASVITGDLSQRMLAGGGETVWAQISEAAKHHAAASGATRIAVLNRAGLVKAATDSALVGRTVPVGGPGTATAPAPDGTNLRVLSVIPALSGCRACHGDEPGVRGYVAVDFDLTPLTRSTAQRRRSIVAVGAAAGLALIALVMLLVRALVLRPIDTLAAAAERLGSGDLRARTTIAGGGEVAMLGRQFNRMAERLQNQVTRIRDAEAESSLLYTLVVEASKNLDTVDVATSVARVVFDKLQPRRVVFFLEAIGGSWICASAGDGAEQRLQMGTGGLATALTSSSAEMNALLDGIPRDLVTHTGDTPHIGAAGDPAGRPAFALPIVADSRLIGLLAATGVQAHLNEELLANLTAHLALAAANSRNYTGAITDAPTGLKNKRYGLARLEDAMYSATRYGSGLAIAMCDIDHFKDVNDTYGHPAGDAVLREVAKRILGSLRKADVAARYGGEEFLLIFPNVPPESLRIIGEKVRESVSAAPVSPGDGAGPLAVTISVGMAVLRGEDDTAEALIGRADTALYRAKQAGRNRLEVDV